MIKRSINQLAFPATMTVGMVLIMLTYNSLLRYGAGLEALRFVVVLFIPILIAAFIVEQVLVSHNVQKLHRLLVRPDATKAKYIVVMSLLMVTGMSLSMTMYVNLTQIGTGDGFWSHYLTSWLLNFPVALIGQMLIVGPLVRGLFDRLRQRKQRPQTTTVLIPEAANG